MKLYYTPGACSMASHIVAREAGLNLDLVKVDLKAKTTEDGRDFTTINPKGYVPALELDDGKVLTEGTAIMQYLADRAPSTGLAPASGTMERYRLQELLGYINSEIHKSFGPLFNPQTPPEQRKEREDYLFKRLGLLDKTLASQPFLTGNTFSAADAYLFVVSNWANFAKLDLSGFPNIQAFQGRVASRPGVQATLKAEGLMQ